MRPTLLFSFLLFMVGCNQKSATRAQYDYQTFDVPSGKLGTIAIIHYNSQGEEPFEAYTFGGLLSSLGDHGWQYVGTVSNQVIMQRAGYSDACRFSVTYSNVTR